MLLPMKNRSFFSRTFLILAGLCALGTNTAQAQTVTCTATQPSQLVLLIVSPPPPASAYLYFGENDGRNGTYTSTPFISGGQVTGHIFPVFCIEGESFEVRFPGKPAMIFIEGRQCLSCTSIEICPISISCDNENNLIMHFANLEQANAYMAQNPAPFFFFGENHPANGRHNTCRAIPPGIVICDEIDCATLVKGQITIIGDGYHCTFEGGSSGGNCSPWADILSHLGNGPCSCLMGTCTDALIRLLPSQEIMECRAFAGPCNTSELISKNSVSIGTSTLHDGGVRVTDGVITDHMKIQMCSDGDWCDYVFEPDYVLDPLDSVQAFVRKHKHLPKMASEQDLLATGNFELKTVTLQQQEKIEEAFLYLIELKKEFTELQEEYAVLKAENKVLKAGQNKKQP